MREISLLWVTTRTARSAEACSISSSSICAARPEVELAGGLVGQQDGISRGEGPRYGYALLLAARQLVGEVARTMSEPHGLQHRLGIGAAAFSGHVHAELDVLQGGQAWETG